MSVATRAGTFGGAAVAYAVHLDEIVLPDRLGHPGARCICFSYCRSPADPLGPVIFAFNGGPGSASLWLHLGLGPRRPAAADSLAPPSAPPFTLVDNEDCPLDVADLVFIDPPGTGYSRVLSEEQEADFYGVAQDATAMVRLVAEWSRRHGREGAAKFLMGESYGAIRAAVMARLSHGGPTQTGALEGLAINGVVLLGATLSLALTGKDGGDIGHATALPSLAATAWYHRRLPADPADLASHVAAAQAYAAGDYLSALFAGDGLDEVSRQAVAVRLHALTGITPDVLRAHNLRLTPAAFADLVLADRGEQVGLYDSRYVLPLAGRGPDPVADDPAMGQYTPAFAGLIVSYLRDELGIQRDDTYRGIEFAAVNSRWDYGSGAGVPPAANYAEDLAVAMRRNRGLELMAASGHFDLVAPAGALTYALAHARLDRARVQLHTYQSGHMPYLGAAARAAFAADLRAFVRRVVAPRR